MYMAYGKALFYFHYLERQLAMFIASWDTLKDREDDRSFGRLLDELHTKTFGALIRQGVKNGSLSTEDEWALSQAKDLRNHLVHHVSDSMVLRMFTKQGPEDVVEEIWDIAAQFRGTAMALNERSVDCQRLRGVSDEDVRKYAAKVIDRAKALKRITDFKPPVSAH